MTLLSEKGMCPSDMWKAAIYGFFHGWDKNQLLPSIVVPHCSWKLVDHIVGVQHRVVLVFCDHCEPVGLVIFDQIVPREVSILWLQDLCLNLTICHIVNLLLVVKQGDCTSGWKCLQSLVVRNLHCSSCERQDCFRRLYFNRNCCGVNKKIVSKHIVKSVQQKLFHSNLSTSTIVEHHAAKIVRTTCNHPGNRRIVKVQNDIVDIVSIYIGL